ncbi:hypothetical protein [Jannaschia ovalis]|uniref:Metal binding domain of Ada n=1 Tax=Jannaschia ovalis TaxID=3038773 RepID=A0ABY8LI32_9RHOB|nr:hypothetical protein [Jannaschia sp. GRR-S6-38]WGH79768.1 hypothetical protein P8627_05765 [Jannaschia sp. GRR-S6-38]
MPRPNRVHPDGSFLTTPARGTLMGNRGILHDAEGRIGPARWRHRNWVCCLLSFRGRHRRLLAPGHYTELFFLDEAVALAAGHRPCAECRRADYRRWQAAWARAFGDSPPAPEMDARLHAARAEPGARGLRHETAKAGDLPDGAVFAVAARAWLRLGGRALPYAPEGWGAPEPLPGGTVRALTNAVTRRILQAGYAPRLHPSAGT